MDLKRLSVLFFYYQLVPFSYQEIVQLSVSPSKGVHEQDTLVLKCVSRPGYTSYQWVLNEEPVVSTTDGGVTYDFHGRDTAVYLVELFDNKVDNKVFKLTITNASRFDNGRWSCILESATGSPERAEENIIAEVEYQPNSRYPECHLNGQSGYAVCTTELGNPRVELTWVDSEGRTIRGQNEDTENLMFISQIEAFTLSPPVGDEEAIECRIALREETRNSSVTKAEIYDSVFLVLVKADDANVFQCSVHPALFRPNLVWWWSSSNGTVATESEHGLNGTSLSLENVDRSATDTAVRCTLVWGVFDSNFVDMRLPADLSNTVFSPETSTSPPRVTGHSEATGTASPKVEGTTAIGRAIGKSTRTSGEQRTLTPSTEGAGQAVLSEHDSTHVAVWVIFIIIIFALIVPLVVFIFAVIYVCFKKSDPPPAVV